MSKRKSIGSLFRLLVYGLILLVLVLVTSIWWLPLALPMALRQFGVEVAAVSRQDSGRLLLAELAYSTDSLSIVADAVEVPSLHLYLWERFGVGLTKASEISIESLQFEMLDHEASADSESEQGDPVTVLQMVRTEMIQAEPWLPGIHVKALTVLGLNQRLLAEVHAIRLSNWQLEVEHLQLLERDKSIVVEASLDPEKPWSALLVLPDFEAQFELKLKDSSEAATLDVQLQQGGGTIECRAVFNDSMWLPASASVTSAHFTLDPRWLAAVDNDQIRSVELEALNLNWQQETYTGYFKLMAIVGADDMRETSLEAEVALSGDLDTLRLETCQVAAAWGQLSLSQPVDVSLQDLSVTQATALQLELDLAQQSFIAASGQVTASLSVAPSFELGPNINFSLDADDLSYGAFAVERAELTGRYAGSRLTIEQMLVLPVGATESERIQVSGEADFNTRSLDFAYEMDVSADWANSQLAQSFFKQEIQADGRLTGTIEQPVLEGSVEALVLEFEKLEPLVITGNFRSQDYSKVTASIRARSQGAVIDADLVLNRVDDSMIAELNKLTWTDPDLPTLELAAPTHVTYRLSGARAYPESGIEVSPFQFVGSEMDVSGHWDPATSLELNLSNINSSRFKRWLKQDLPVVAVESVALSLQQLRPQLLGSLEVHLESSRITQGAALRVDLAADFQAEQTELTQLQLNFAGERLLQGSMIAPLGFQVPESDNRFWWLHQDGVLEGNLSGSASRAFSEWLTETTGYQLGELSLDMDVAGSLRNPLGVLNLQLASLETSLEQLPVIEAIQLVARADTEVITVERFNFSLNQSNVSGALTLPLQASIDVLQGGDAKRLAWLNALSGRIELNEWDAENWVSFLPTIMRRSGQLSGTLELRPKLDLQGELAFSNFAIRPTRSLSSIESIGGQLVLVDRKLTIKDASALVGGSLVQFYGWLDAEKLKDPLWNIHVVGENVPLARTTDMILRSDLDITMMHEKREEAPLVSGALNLQSSAVLVDFDPLSPSVESGAKTRPPFFSITEPTVADWRFDIKIFGDSFMRVRSPYFKTQLTASFDLGGTFAVPLLIGYVRTNEGELNFPGAKMRVNVGEAYIERDRPDVVKLDFVGTAQKASHIITMDVSQTLDDPQVHFQSTPDMSNASIVRLLATGSTHGSGVGAVGLYLGQGLLGAGGMEESLLDRLTIDVGEETSRAGRNTVGVQYELFEDLYIDSEYDVYDAYNLDFIWSIFKR